MALTLRTNRRPDGAGRAAIEIVFQGDVQLFVPLTRKDAKLGGAQTKRDLNLSNLEMKA
jgi:hypothetical protein